MQSSAMVPCGTQLLCPKEEGRAGTRHLGCFWVQFTAMYSVSRSLPMLETLPYPCQLEQCFCPCLDPASHQPGPLECAVVWDGVARSCN